MVSALVQREKDKYEKMWALPKYWERSPGMRTVDHAMQKAIAFSGDTIKTVIDIGAGSGRVANRIKEVWKMDVAAMDIAENSMTEFDGPKCFGSITGLDTVSSLPRFDLAFCADVLEHVPTELIHDTIKNIAYAARFSWLQIANFHCHEGDEIGEILHLTVKPFEWWQEILKSQFKFHYMERAPKHHNFLLESLISARP